MDHNFPQSPETEGVIIGLIFSNNDYVWELIKTLKADDFYVPLNQKIVQAMISLANDSKSIDYVLVKEYIKKEYKEVIELSALAAYTKNLPLTFNFDEYLTIVLTKSIERQKIRLHGAAQTAIITGVDASEFTSKLDEVTRYSKKTIFYKPSDILETVVKGIYEQGLVGSGISGLRTGFKKLDYMTGGLQNSDLILIAARPSMGKTAFALNLAENICFHDPDAVIAFFSLEMSAKALQTRMLASVARIDAQRMKLGYNTPEDWARLVWAREKLKNIRLHINDDSGTTVSSMRAYAKTLLKEEKRLDGIIVDYVQLMDSDIKSQSIEQETSVKSKGLKNLAKELNVPLVALSQLSRSPESRGDHRPQLSDLRYSGSLEQDADVVAFIFREEQYERTEENIGLAELIIAKQRNGPTGTCPFLFIKELTRFETLFRAQLS